MKKITQKELDKKIELYRRWLIDNSKGVKLDLSDIDLSYDNLRSINLIYIIDSSNKNGIKLKRTNKYNTAWAEYITAIGCDQNNNIYFKNLTSEQVEILDKGADEWWQDNKEYILKIIKGKNGNKT